MHKSRGQTLPFWAMTMTGVLSSIFFVANYTQMLTWQVRAQTAADSFAAVAVSADANVYNQETILAYLAAIQEYRTRSLLGMLMRLSADRYFTASDCAASYDGGANELQGYPGSPPPANPIPNSAMNCDYDYDAVSYQLNNSINQLTLLGDRIQTMSETINPYTQAPEIEGGIATSQSAGGTTGWTDTIKQASFWSSNNLGGYSQLPPVNQDFSYSVTFPTNIANTLPNETVNVVACKTVSPPFAFPFFQPTKVIGRSVATLVHTDEIVNPGLTGPSGGACTSVNDTIAGTCSLVSYGISTSNVLYSDGNPLQPAEYPTEYAAPPNGNNWTGTNPPLQTDNPLNCMGGTCGAGNPYAVDFSNLTLRLSWYGVGYLPPQSKVNSPC